MKKFKIFMIMAGIILTLVGCGNNDINETKYKVSFLDFKKDTKEYKYDIKVPQIEEAKTEDEEFFNVSMKEMARNLIDNMAISENEGDFSDVYITSNEYINNFGILSLGVNTNLMFTGAAHSQNMFETFNFNKDMTLITFENLFSADDIDFYNDYINNLIKTHAKIKNTNGTECILFDDAEANINDAAYYFEGDNLVFVFPQYNLGPYSSGMPVFKIKKDIVLKHSELKK